MTNNPRPPVRGRLAEEWEQFDEIKPDLWLGSDLVRYAFYSGAGAFAHVLEGEFSRQRLARHSTKPLRRVPA
jgi:hypothetical protein